MNSKYHYLKTSLKKTICGQGRICPACSSVDSDVVDRKALVTSLRRCSVCKLLFRAPTTTSEENASFYQSEYSQGFTTDVPNSETLKELLDCGFKGHEKSYDMYIAILRSLGLASDARIFDFGCSWGYGSYQLQRAGFEVRAFEISMPRATYAKEKLGVDLVNSLDDFGAPFDVFFSSHVIEHVPNPLEMFRLARAMVKKGGYFVCLTPNGSDAFRQLNSEQFHKFWGLVHPQLIDDQFVRMAFPDSAVLIASNPYDFAWLKAWKKDTIPYVGPLTGAEFLFVVKI